MTRTKRSQVRRHGAVGGRRRVLFKALLACGSLVVALVGAELVARVIAHTSHSFDYLPFFDRVRPDADMGWRYYDNWRFSVVTEDGETIEGSVSGEGFPTPSVPPKDEPQLVILGDSFLAGAWHVRRPIAQVIQDELEVPVYNLAVGGLGPESYRAAYEKFALGRQHEIVLVFSFLNDVSDVTNFRNWRSSDEPSFRQWLFRHYPEHYSGNRGQSWLDRHSRLWNLAKYRLQGEKKVPARPEDLERFPSAAGAPFEMLFTRDMPFMQLDPSAFMPEGSYFDALAAYFESLDRLKATIEGNGARMVLIWIPSKERVHLPLLPGDRFERYVTNDTGRIDGLEAALTLYAEERGLSFLDLSEPLTRRAAEGEKLYFTIDGHCNQQGQQAVGEIVSAFVTALPDAPAPVDPRARRLLRRHDIVAPLPMSPAWSEGGMVKLAGPGLTVRGSADTPFAYLARWNPIDVEAGAHLVVRGTVRRGGFTFGLLDESGAWYVKRDVEGHGPFESAVRVPASGTYTVLIANCLRGESRENDFEINAIGWSEPDVP